MTIRLGLAGDGTISVGWAVALLSTASVAKVSVIGVGVSITSTVGDGKASKLDSTRAVQPKRKRRKKGNANLDNVLIKEFITYCL